jgi:septal ring factor EnvC (AmiA/AmiB activator)
MRPSRRLDHPRITAAAAAMVALLVLSAVLPFSSLAASSIDQLNSSLGHQQARAQSLSASVASLSSLISSLDGQIALVQSREAAVRTELGNDRLALAGVQRSLTSERALLGVLETRLSWARTALSRQLVSSYEGDKPDLVRVVLDAHGFKDLLENVDFLHRAEQQQQALISITRSAKAQADTTAERLTKLEAGERRITQNAALRAAALAGMNSLLQSKQAALAQARAAQQSALAAARARGAQLQQEIAKVQAAQAAAQAAAARASLSSQPSSSAAGPGAGPALGPSGGWAIPYAIVLCESGGQNLPPNSAGASGYYQIIPSTWTSFGGSGPAAYLASKAEQDSVAASIYRGGAGVSNWDCARIVGITH